MRQKIFFSKLLLLPFVFCFLNVQVVQADVSEEAVIEKGYSLSDSFEQSENNDFYIYDPENPAVFTSFWTKTGSIVSIFDVDNFKNFKEEIFGYLGIEPAAQTSSSAQVPLLWSGSTLITGSVTKIFGTSPEIFASVGYLGVFLVLLSLEIVFIFFWFLRLSTGVSPPYRYSSNLV